MTRIATPAAKSHARPTPVGRVLFVAVALLAAVSCGCSRLRLPAIDPTGSCLFAEKPTTTTFAFPCMDQLQNFGARLKGRHQDLFNKDGKIGSCLTKPRFVLPDPAFPEPVTPPACPTPDQSSISGAVNEPYVPSADCNGSCKDGPPAVLFGDECKLHKALRLPKKGKRGCILLSPQKIVAPVGGEVVLLSGICGTDGYLQMNERLEWMLTPDSVGTFIQVGDDDPGLLHRLAGSRVRPKKHDPSYAIGVTSTKRTLITRGNKDDRDDVQLEKGQTWITISSPSEGTSRVTVLAPDSECWDQRKATATIYWVDARWTFPAPQRVPAGQPVNLTTRVTRSEEAFPARGWKVRYEILNPDLATIAGPDGSVAEVIVDDSGNANVQLIPTPNTSGTAAINMTVIRPGGEQDNLPDLTLGSGQTFVTWSAPQLAVRAIAPEVATFNVPVPVEVIVSNPGDQEATGVRVEVQLPPGTQANSTDGFAQVLPNAITWEIGSIPPQMELPLTMNIAAQSPIALVFQARGDNGLLAEGRTRIDVFRPSLAVDVAPVQERVETGERVTFNIDVTNTGDRPLTNASLTATGDEGMIHEQGGRVVTTPTRQQPLQPGETWGVEVVFIPTDSGRRCVSFEATADGGQRGNARSCVTVINPVPRTPRIEAVLESPVSRLATGQSTLVRARVANTGDAVAQNVAVTMVYDPQFQPAEATVGADKTRVGQNIISWSLPEIAPGQEVKFEGVFNAIGVNPRARVAVNVRTQDGQQADEEIFLEILDGSVPAQPDPPATLPPAQPAPEIPGGRAPAPLQGAPPAQPPAAVPQGPQRSEQLQVRLFLRDNPRQVNQPIRYAIQVFNDASVQDGQVGIQFELPNGVSMDRFVRTTNPELTEAPRINAGIVTIPDIRVMNPGETVDFELVLRSNQPQVFPLTILVRSQRMPNGITQTVNTTVVP